MLPAVTLELCCSLFPEHKAVPAVVQAPLCAHQPVPERLGDQQTQLHAPSVHQPSPSHGAPRQSLSGSYLQKCSVHSGAVGVFTLHLGWNKKALYTEAVSETEKRLPLQGTFGGSQASRHVRIRQCIKFCLLRYLRFAKF